MTNLEIIIPFTIKQNAPNHSLVVREDGGVNINTSSANLTAKLYIQGRSLNWNETIQGTGVGTIHLDPGSSTDFVGNAITFGASDSSSGTTGQAGIYVRSDGSFGTKMYFSTTNSYATGAKTAMFIGHDGKIGINVSDPDSNLEINRGLINFYNNRYTTYYVAGGGKDMERRQNYVRGISQEIKKLGTDKFNFENQN